MKDEDKKKIKISAGDTEVQKIVSVSEIERIGTISMSPNVVPLSVGIHNPVAELKVSALKNYDLVGRNYGAEAILSNPSFYDGTLKTITGRNGLENITLAGTQPSGALKAISLESPATMDFNPSFTSLRLATNLNESNLTREDIENLIDKKTSKKDDGLKKEQVIEIVKELNENRSKQENENILVVNKNGLDFITKELLAGKERAWHCGKCGKPLEIFKGEESIEKMKKYLINFRNNISKKCANGHDNWFELKEDGINWVVKVIYEKEFRLKS